MQSVSSRNWTRVAVFISYDDNDYTTGTSIFETDLRWSALKWYLEQGAYILKYFQAESTDTILIQVRGFEHNTVNQDRENKHLSQIENTYTKLPLGRKPRKIFWP